MLFHIVSPVFNAEGLIGDAIRSAKAQDHPEFRHVVVDDLSTDDTVVCALDAMGDDTRFRLLRNETKHYSLGGYWRAIRASDPSDDDVIVILDGDDRLVHSRVLARLAEVYEDSECWLTYGSYAGPNGERDSSCKPYRESTVRRRLYRARHCPVPHLRTFRYKLWKRIPWKQLTVSNEEVNRARRRALLHGRWRSWWHWRGIRADDLVDPTGRFTRRLSDKVPCYAMLEMAGEHARFIGDVLLHYNADNKDLGFPVREPGASGQKWFTRLIREVIEHRDPLPALDDSAVELASSDWDVTVAAEDNQITGTAEGYPDAR